tara:strand:- start:1681 stop:2358 length:678 start_codon:yes stop_codon:yes gene_type:complete
MDKLTNLFDIDLNTVNTADFLIGFFLIIIFSFAIKIIYEKYSLSVSNKVLTSSLFPLFGMAIFIIVITIKSSLVLSLGLVGALSIIRFRTAVKEQEQIIFLLILTAVSISIAAGQYMFSLCLVLFIFFYSAYRKRTYLSSSISNNDQLVLKFDSLNPKKLEEITNYLTSTGTEVTIQNYNIKPDYTVLVLKISNIDVGFLISLESEIQEMQNTTLLDLQLINSID